MKQSIFSALLVAIFIAFFALVAGSASAQMPTKMIGYAWAPNFGWINFGDGIQAYPKVTVTNGVFDGVAWSRNLGWIRMGANLQGPANQPISEQRNVRAEVTATGANIKGWMRACSAYVDPVDCGRTKPSDVRTVSGTERGGWDGWFKLKDVAYNASSKRYTGFGWGDLVGGWVNMAATGASADDPKDCDPTIEVCGGDPGTSYTCTVASSPLVTGSLTATWTASPSGYSYDWYKNGSLTALPTHLSPLTETYSYANTVNGAVTMKVTFKDPVTSEIKASNVVCGTGVTISGKCSLAVDYVPNKVAPNSVKDGDFEFPDITPRSNYYDCGDDVTLVADRDITWSGTGVTCPRGKNCTVTANNNTVTANFGGGDVPTITFTGTNQVLIPDNLKESNKIPVQVLVGGTNVAGSLSPSDFSIVTPQNKPGIHKFNPSITFEDSKIGIILDTNDRDRYGNTNYTIKIKVTVDGVESNPTEMVVRDNQSVTR